MLSPKKMRPWSPLASILALLAISDVCQAGRRSRGVPDIDRAESMLNGLKETQIANVTLYYTDDVEPESFLLPTGSETLCFNVVKSRYKKVSGVEVGNRGQYRHVCRFHFGRHCRDSFFDADHTVDMINHPEIKSWDYNVQSVSCSSMEPPKYPLEWGDLGAKAQLCPRLKTLRFQLRMAEGGQGSTNDVVSMQLVPSENLIFSYGPRNYSIATGLEGGREYQVDVNLTKSFGMDTIALDHIGGVELFAGRQSWKTGGNKWNIKDIVLSGDCADRNLSMIVHKFFFMNQDAQGDGHPDHLDDKNLGYRAWSGELEAKDWTPRLACGKVRGVHVTIRMYDAMWSGTHSSLYATVAKKRRWIYDAPWRTKFYTGFIKLPDVQRSEIDAVGIDLGHRVKDNYRIQGITLRAVCSDTYSMQYVDKDVSKPWTYIENATSVSIYATDWRYIV